MLQRHGGRRDAEVGCRGDCVASLQHTLRDGPRGRRHGRRGGDARDLRHASDVERAVEVGQLHLGRQLRHQRRDGACIATLTTERDLDDGGVESHLRERHFVGIDTRKFVFESGDVRRKVGDGPRHARERQVGAH